MSWYLLKSGGFDLIFDKVSKSLNLWSWSWIRVCCDRKWRFKGVFDDNAFYAQGETFEGLGRRFFGQSRSFLMSSVTFLRSRPLFNFSAVAHFSWSSDFSKITILRFGPLLITIFLGALFNFLTFYARGDTLTKFKKISRQPF